jgi:FkbM family methyltransferase
VDFAYLIKSAKSLAAHPTFRSSPFRTLGRAVVWGLHCLLRRPVIVQPGGGYPGRLFLPPRFQGSGGTTIFVLGEYVEHDELEWVKRAVAEGMTFVDAGANIGVYTVLASKLAGESGAVISFEPSRTSFSVLQRNVELNKCMNVRAFRAALSDRTGQASLYHIDNRPNVFSLGASSVEETSEHVDTMTLDGALAGLSVDRVHFLKLDVEGAEELVLRGAEKVLRASHPTIMFEYSERPSRLGLDPDGAWRLLEEAGYRLHAVDQTGQLVPRDSLRPGNNVAVFRA